MLECRMDENGVLYINATTPVERYALGKWGGGRRMRMVKSRG